MTDGFDEAQAEVFERVKPIIARIIGLDPDVVGPDKDLRKDLGADSLDISDINLACEEEFEIEIPNEDAKVLATARDYVNYITRRLTLG
jgi:acyl carrier protein